EKLEGNRTNKSLYDSYLKILELEGYDEELLKLADNDEIDVSKIAMPALEIKMMVKSVFEILGINTSILEFEAELDGKTFETQPSYQLWHLLYSYEDDDSPSGHERLYKLLNEKYGFKLEHCKILAGVTFSDDYGSLSTKAIRKIYPFIKELTYDKACFQAGYRHSAQSIPKDENEKRPLQKRLE